MEHPVRVLSTMAFPDDFLERLRAVSERLHVVQHTAASADEVPDELWREVDVLYTGACFPAPERAARLRWVQLDTSGVDHVRTTPLWASDVDITTLNGVAPSNMAEFALMMMLNLARRSRLMDHHQRHRYWPTYQERWDWFMPSELRGATVGVVGYGSIGREVARVCHALGMRVLAMRRSGNRRRQTFRITDLEGSLDPEPDRTYTPDQLGEMLPECDYVVLILPHTTETTNMIDEAAFRAMKPSAVLINIARGGIVDEAAMIRALQEGRIAGAALDVFEEEPLPADSPLWAMENVIISPHVAGFTPHYHDRVFGVFSQNLVRFLEGEPLLNLADRAAGY